MSVTNGTLSPVSTKDVDQVLFLCLPSSDVEKTKDRNKKFYVIIATAILHLAFNYSCKEFL